jgi:hypothetical protein
MQARYRADYAGEFVIHETKWTGGKKLETREWVANPITNQHISGRAVCVGSTVDQYLFDYTRLQRHRGGLLSSKKLQTYGVGDIAKQMRLDFAVETNNQQLQDILQSNYQTDNVVYTSPRHCIAHPGEFYLIPLRPNITDMATLIYLAAFDGHKEIFLLGYHRETPNGRIDWIDEITGIFYAYPGVQFYLVGEATIMPESWLNLPNVQTQTYQAWISHCDI